MNRERPRVGVPQFVDVTKGAAAQSASRPPANLDVANACEVVTVEQAFPLPPFGLNQSKEFPVYTTSKRWRACDVFVSTDALLDGTRSLIVRVYAVKNGGGGRSLVASGMLGFSGVAVDDGVSGTLGKWVAAARAVSSAFEVTLQYGGAPIANVTDPVFVSIVASDEADDPPDLLGAVYAGQGAGTQVVVDPSVVSPVELVGVTAVNTAAAARYLLLLEGGATSPDWVWPLGAVAGGGVSDMRFRRRMYSGFSLFPSSTAGLYTAVTDCFVQALIR